MDEDKLCVICGASAWGIALFSDEIQEIERPKLVCKIHYEEWKLSYDSKMN